MQVEVPCEPEMSTHSCRDVVGGPQLPGSSGACNQTDHLITYHCDHFQRLIQESGWKCVTSWDAMGQPDEWILNKHGIYGAMMLSRGVETWVSEFDKKQLLCVRLPVGGGRSDANATERN